MGNGVAFPILLIVSVPNLDLSKEEPYSNEPKLEDSLHLAQIALVLTCLEWWQKQDFFEAANPSIYYQPLELQSNVSSIREVAQKKSWGCV